VKQPYMAPDSNSFFQADSPEYIKETVSAESIAKTGIFKPEYVGKLVEKCGKLSHAHLSFKDNMSFIGILSTQLLVDRYIDNYRPAPPLGRDKFKTWHENAG